MSEEKPTAEDAADLLYEWYRDETKLTPTRTECRYVVREACDAREREVRKEYQTLVTLAEDRKQLRFDSDWGHEVWLGNERVACEPTHAKAVAAAIRALLAEKEK